jgi:hypothetical protein
MEEGIQAVMTKAGSVASKLFGLLTRTIGTLSVVIVSFGFVAAVEFSVVDGGRHSIAEVNSIEMASIQNLHVIGRAMMIIDGAENVLLAIDIDERKRRSIYAQFDAAKKDLVKSQKAYDSLPRSPEEVRGWEDFVRALERWNNDHERFVQLARVHEKTGTPETYKSMSAQALGVNQESLLAAVSLLDAIIDARLGGRQEKSESTKTVTSSYQEYIVGALVLGGSTATVAIIALLIKRARRHHRRFRMGNGRLRLDDVDRYGSLFSYTRPVENNEEAK